MKSKTLAVIIIAAICIALISCHWFSKKHSLKKTMSLVGKWKIENIIDSSKQQKNGIGLLALAVITKDSLPLFVDFNADSTFSLYQNKPSLLDSGKYYFDSTAQTVFVKQDSSLLSLNIKHWSDSSLQLFSSEDSVWYALSKQ
jgi:hypothetical protein